MLFGSVNSSMFEDQLSVLPPVLAAAIRFLKETDLASHKPGKFDLRLADTDMILQVLDLKTAPRQSLRPEIHRKYIDVQFLAAGGPEMAGYFCDDGSLTVSEDLLATPRDILFYDAAECPEEGTIKMLVGSYAVYFPWDVHIPAIQCSDAPADIRKIVIKVPMDACRR